MEHRDVIVIGAGPAGLTAGMYCSCYGLSTLIIEEKMPGGCAAEIPLLENYPGLSEGIAGKDLIEKIVQQCGESGAEIHQFEKVLGLNFNDDEYVLKTDGSDYRTDAVILAMGRRYELLDIPGEKEFRGKGVSYCAVCDGHFFKDKKVAVVGHDCRAAEVAIYLSGLASDVKLVCQGKDLCAEKVCIDDLAEKKVEICNYLELKEITGDINVTGVVLADSKTGETRDTDIDGVFIQSNEIPNSEIVSQAGIDVDENSYIIIDENSKTNIDRVYAVGDITTNPVKLVVTAASQAAVAATDLSRNISRYV
ncbi:MAG: FAD-dependent oxidoreductase [Candidatus Latescibacteria bacterium]|nr:FAD-dependent oxidoreductase [Candidatus Latescibacterota bacterium]